MAVAISSTTRVEATGRVELRVKCQCLEEAKVLVEEESMWLWKDFFEYVL